MSDLFPELQPRDDGSRSKHESSDRPAPPVRKLRLGPASKALRGGRYALEKFAALLGMAAARDGPRLSRAEVLLGNGRIELSFDGGDLDGTVLRLVPCESSAEHKTDFMFMLRGPVKTEAVRRLIEKAQRRLSKAPYRLLLKVLRLDKERALVDAPFDHDASFDELFQRSVVRTYDGELAWRTFFAELEQQRNFNHYLAGNVVVVNHEDLECAHATPSLDDGSISFINYSAIHRCSGQRREQIAREQQHRHWGQITTDLDDLDVIGGGARRLDEALQLIADSEGKPDLVMVKTACVPKVAGDDLSPSLQRFEASTGVPTVFLDNLADERNDFFSTVLERLSLEPLPHAPELCAGKINLVGYPDVDEMNELLRLLEPLGVRINARLVPRVHIEDVRRYNEACVQVLFDSAMYAATFEQLLGNVDMPTLRPPPPYGFQSSREWVREVARAAGASAAIDPLFDEVFGALQDQYASKQHQAREHRLGFVVDEHWTDRLLAPRRASGVPMLDLLQEMGFSLEFLCYQDGALVTQLPGSCKHFSEPEQLETLLRESSASAFYSEYFFDRRLSRTGKAQFSIADFLPGPRGALATLDRVLQICSLPFYRRHARHLGAPFGQPEVGDVHQEP